MRVGRYRTVEVQILNKDMIALNCTIRFTLFVTLYFTCLVSCLRSQQRVPLNSQILEETDQHRVETFGFPLPVQISEALTSIDGILLFMYLLDVLNIRKYVSLNLHMCHVLRTNSIRGSFA